jgi:hypothetical protein
MLSLSQVLAQLKMFFEHSRGFACQRKGLGSMIQSKLVNDLPVPPFKELLDLRLVRLLLHMGAKVTIEATKGASFIRL